jgi:hypothetical protein
MLDSGQRACLRPCNSASAGGSPDCIRHTRRRSGMEATTSGFLHPRRIVSLPLTCGCRCVCGIPARPWFCQEFTFYTVRLGERNRQTQGQSHFFSHINRRDKCRHLTAQRGCQHTRGTCGIGLISCAQQCATFSLNWHIEYSPNRRDVLSSRTTGERLCGAEEAGVEQRFKPAQVRLLP